MSESAARLQLLYRILADGAEAHVVPLLDVARRRAYRTYTAAGANDIADRLAAGEFAAHVVVELAVDGQLDPEDTRVTVGALAEARNDPPEAAALDVFQRAVRSPTLFELPPLVSAELVLRLLAHLDVASEVSLWRSMEGKLEPVLLIGTTTVSRRTRATARAALRRREGALSIVGANMIRSAVVRRFDEPFAVVVARIRPGDAEANRIYLEQAASALSPLLEREGLLERSAQREVALVAGGEKRLVRLGLDLHDGPVQDVLALGAEISHLKEQLGPLLADEHRDLALGRLDDVLARLVELDRAMREIAHSLESRSIVSRPLGEILHREVDAYAERTGIDARLDISGDPESLTAAQRIAVFRAIQESLANVREHSGATAVDIRLSARRGSINVRVTDNGHGFEVSRALARAAQRGRLGLVGIGERVRMLGGTFEIDSEPGGPTTLRFALPRVTPE